MKSLFAVIEECFSAARLKGALTFYESQKAYVSFHNAKVQLVYCPLLNNKSTSSESNCASVDCNANTTSTRKMDTVNNPFKDPEKDLVISADFSPKYRLLLNKFCIRPYHVLFTSKDFEAQDSSLKLQDFEEIVRFLTDTSFSDKYPLVFYNCGPFSGASQPHRHFQGLLFDSAAELPLPSAFCVLGKNSLPFLSFISFCGPQAIRCLYDFYTKSLATFLPYTASFNLIWTRDFFLLIPRRNFPDSLLPGLSINSLGCLGLILVKGKEDFENLSKNPRLIEILYAETFYPNLECK